jgi:hypothetical protein
VVPSRKLVVISEGVNFGMHQGGVEGIGEGFAGVFTPETQENIVIPSRFGR